MTIQKLPLDVIKLIAAGEVIDSLTAVVRELVENSLDANAQKIVVSISPESWTVQVADNGNGISRDDLTICIEAHTTSKITSSQDLSKISTLGFRGEALHSIAQLSHLEIASRIQDDCGWQISCENKQIIDVVPRAIASGTIVTVNDLFGNIPLRRQGNPPFKQQLKQIQTLIGQLALCHPQVTWQLFVNEKLNLHISGRNKSEEILPQLLKTIKPSDLKSLTVKINDNSFLNLLVGLPDRLSRPRPDWVKIGLNGRVVKCPELESSIFASFHRTLPRDRFPVIFIHLQISPAEIDWNRHPAKAEIYLHNLEFWQEQIKQGISEIFKINDHNLSNKYENKRVEKLLTVAENKPTYNLSENLTNIEDKNEQKSTIGLIELEVIAQARNTYIIAEHSEGIWLIEQHIAHERILYEQLQNQWEIVKINSPIILNNLKPKQINNLQNLEIEIEPFGEDLWAVRSLPLTILDREDSQEVLIELSWGGDLDSAIVAIACRTAIRNGKKLKIKEMQNLINQWKITKNPHTCPHGRPIYLSLEESSLYRFFRRSWVLGKSHGI